MLARGSEVQDEEVTERQDTSVIAWSGPGILKCDTKSTYFIL